MLPDPHFLPAVAAGHDVVKSPGELDADATRHGSTIVKMVSFVKKCCLTPISLTPISPVHRHPADDFSLGRWRTVHRRPLTTQSCGKIQGFPPGPPRASAGGWVGCLKELLCTGHRGMPG